MGNQTRLPSSRKDSTCLKDTLINLGVSIAFHFCFSLILTFSKCNKIKTLNFTFFLKQDRFHVRQKTCLVIISNPGLHCKENFLSSYLLAIFVEVPSLILSTAILQLSFLIISSFFPLLAPSNDWRYTTKAFIFTLRNKEGLRPFKSMVIAPQWASSRRSGYGSLCIWWRLGHLHR